MGNSRFKKNNQQLDWNKLYCRDCNCGGCHLQRQGGCRRKCAYWGNHQREDIWQKGWRKGHRHFLQLNQGCQSRRGWYRRFVWIFDGGFCEFCRTRGSSYCTWNHVTSACLYLLVESLWAIQFEWWHRSTVDFHV